MEITEIPFNRYIGIEKSGPSHDGQLELGQSANLINHLNTMHASAQFALAEAASGECLLRRFGDLASAVSLIPVVREVQVKYRKPATGTLRARATIDDAEAGQAIDTLARKGRTLIQVSVDVLDEANDTTMKASFAWFIQKVEGSLGGDSNP